MKNCGDNVFAGIPVGGNEASLFGEFLAAHDLADHSRRGFTHDIKKFAKWFTTSNGERFVIGRVTTRDITDFRNYLRRDQGQAVATVNRNLSRFAVSSGGSSNMVISPPILPSRSRS